MRLQPGDLVIHTDVPAVDYGEVIAVENDESAWDADCIVVQWSKGDQNHVNAIYLKKISPLIALAFEGQENRA